MNAPRNTERYGNEYARSFFIKANTLIQQRSAKYVPINSYDNWFNIYTRNNFIKIIRKRFLKFLFFYWGFYFSILCFFLRTCDTNDYNQQCSSCIHLLNWCILLVVTVAHIVSLHERVSMCVNKQFQYSAHLHSCTYGRVHTSIRMHCVSSLITRRNEDDTPHCTV